MQSKEIREPPLHRFRETEGRIRPKAMCQSKIRRIGLHRTGGFGCGEEYDQTQMLDRVEKQGINRWNAKTGPEVKISDWTFDTNSWGRECEVRNDNVFIVRSR